MLCSDGLCVSASLICKSISQVRILFTDEDSLSREIARFISVPSSVGIKLFLDETRDGKFFACAT